MTEEEERLVQLLLKQMTYHVDKISEIVKEIEENSKKQSPD